ncbi:MAG: 5,6-dimethylbenzimidazole synthase [bacterium]|nr:5,6-dimethylbenzimidazole synthase [bacterium]
MDIYEAIRSRRDVRKFRSDEVADHILERILQAGHQAPSVGFSQPWRFLLIRSLDTRKAVRRLFDEANERASAAYTGERRKLYDSFKLEGILEAPLNLCVLCDRRTAEPTLGAQSIPETDVFSTCLAIENLWLAARAEGVGIGWVSIVEPKALRSLLELPDGVEIVGYLCVGYPEAFLERPLLEKVGWRDRMPLEEIVYEERFESKPPQRRKPS